MKRLILLLVSFVFIFSGWAQQAQVFKTPGTNPLRNLDKKYFTRNFVRDFSTGKTDWQEAQKQVVTDDLFDQVYFEVFNSSLEQQVPELEKLIKAANNYQDDNSFLVSVIDIDYNKLVENTENEFTTQHLFIAGVPSQRKYTGKKVTFVFDKDFFITDNDNINYFLISFDGGKSWQEVYPGGQAEASFSTEGEKLIDLKAIYKDGSIRQTAFKVNIRSPKVTADETWKVTADIPYKDEYATVEAGIFLGSGNSDITRPVVIVDGYDPENSRGIPEIYDLANQQNMFDDLLAQGYDAVVINNLAGADYIQRNAFAFIKVIQMINDRMKAAGTYGNQIIVIGPSMGGLITRYGLRYMELNGMQHNVKLWISFDSPQRGANVPLGIQHWVRFFADEGDSEDAQRALDALNAPAAQQMLIYHYTSTYSGQFPNQNYADFYNEINQMGFPVSLRRVAIINGSGYGNGQPFSYGDQLIYYHYNSFLVDIVGDVWAVPTTNTQNTIFHGIIDILGPWYEEETITYAYTLPLDGAPGGSANTMEEMDNIDPEYGDIKAYYPDHSFIPTISSLALYGIYDPYYNVAANAGNLNTPFDAVYYPNWNQDHMYIDQQSKAWFMNEITNAKAIVGTPYHKLNTTTRLDGKQTLAGAERQHVEFSQVTVLPNPATDYFMITNAANSNVTVYDITGKVVLTKRITTANAVINTSNWQPGVYFVRITNAGMDETKRVIVK